MSLPRSKPPEQDADSVTIGVVLRPHGVKGEVVVEPLTDNQERFARLDDVQVVRVSGSSSRLRVASMFSHKGRFVIRFEGMAGMDEAEALRGAELRIPIAALPELPEGSYYHHELEGLEVRIESGASIGRVAEVWETGPTPVLVIRDGAGRETLLPLVDSFIVEVDVKNGFMRVKEAGTVSGQV